MPPPTTAPDETKLAESNLTEKECELSDPLVHEAVTLRIFLLYPELVGSNIIYIKHGQKSWDI